MAYLISGGLLLLGIALLVLERSVANIPDPVASVLFGLGTLFASVGGALVGRAWGLADAITAVRPLTEPAYRRTLSLYDALGRVLDQVVEHRARIASQAQGTAARVPLSEVELALEVVRVQLGEQLETVNFAAQEWETLLPDRVQRLREQAQGQQAGGR